MPPFRPSGQQYHHYCWPREVGTRDNPPSSPGMRKVTERFDGERMAWTYEWKVFYEVVMVSHDLWLFLRATEVIRIGKKKKTKGCYKEYGWIRTTFTFFSWAKCVCDQHSLTLSMRRNSSFICMLTETLCHTQLNMTRVYRFKSSWRKSVKKDIKEQSRCKINIYYFP